MQRRCVKGYTVAITSLLKHYTQTHTDTQVHAGHLSKVSKFAAHMLESSLYWNKQSLVMLPSGGAQTGPTLIPDARQIKLPIKMMASENI